MKKLIASLIAGAGLAYASHAAVLLNEPFTYSDGSLITVSSGTWFTHSGTTPGQVDVSSGLINITGAETEDVSRAITPGTGYTTPLYGSFKVNFSTLPASGTTTYFAHFSQNSTTFRCKIFSTISGAASNKYRLGVANGAANTAVIIPTDLDLNTEYKLVFRLTNNTANVYATLWINPTSESSMVNRADGTDATTLGTYVSTNFSFRQATGIGAMTVDDLLVGDQFSDVQTVGGPPSISGLVATSIPANSNTGPMPFLISDVETPAASLIVTATSSNPTLVPNNPANLTFGGSDGNRTLTVTPASGEQGTASIEVVVTDASSATATNTFTLTVGSPSISSIASQITPAGTVKSVAFWVNDAETTPLSSLTVTATSSDQAVLPDANIAIVDLGGTNRMLHLTNAAAGAATVTVSVADGTFTIPTTFVLTAYPDNDIVLGEDFNGGDGPISSMSAFAPNWNTHSAGNGATGQTMVVSGKLLLTNNASEDINHWFTNAPLQNTSGALLHSRFVVNFSQLPTDSSGEYFAHFYAFNGGYRGRIIATTNGAPAGKYRLLISNGNFAATAAAFPQSFSLNEPHVVIVRYNTATCESTLWVDPTSESSTSVTGTDSASAVASVYGYAFRQQSGIGSMSIDDLLIGSTFSQVLLVLHSSNANLFALALSDGTLAPTFAPATTIYTASVPNTTSSITVTPTAADATATIEVQVNGGGYSAVTSGSPSGALPLNVGANAIDVKVTASDTTTVKTYSTTVTRASAAPTTEPIAFQTEPGKLIMSWTQGAFSLASSTNVAGPYEKIISATSPYTNSVTNGTMFFKLVYP